MGMNFKGIGIGIIKKYVELKAEKMFKTNAMTLYCSGGGGYKCSYKYFV